MKKINVELTLEGVSIDYYLFDLYMRVFKRKCCFKDTKVSYEEKEDEIENNKILFHGKALIESSNKEALRYYTDEINCLKSLLKEDFIVNYS